MNALAAPYVPAAAPAAAPDHRRSDVAVAKRLQRTLVRDWPEACARLGPKAAAQDMLLPQLAGSPGNDSFRVFGAELVAGASLSAALLGLGDDEPVLALQVLAGLAREFAGLGAETPVCACVPACLHAGLLTCWCGLGYWRVVGVPRT